jgi:hypothetical protein
MQQPSSYKNQTKLCFQSINHTIVNYKDKVGDTELQQQELQQQELQQPESRQGNYLNHKKVK